MGGRRPVHIQSQHRHPAPPRVREQQPLRVHPGVMGEQPGVEGRRVVRLEPGRLVRRYGEGDRVRLAEAVTAERLDDLPGAGRHFGVVALLRRPQREPRPDPVLRFGVGEPAPHPVGLVPAAAGHDVDHLDDLLVEDDHPVRLAQRPFQIGVRVAHGGPAVPGLDERPHHVGGDRSGAEQRDVDHQVVEAGRLEPADQVALARRLDLEAAQRLGAPDHPVRLRVVRLHGVQVHGLSRGPSDLRDRVRHRRLHPYPDFRRSPRVHSTSCRDCGRTATWREYRSTASRCRDSA